MDGKKTEAKEREHMIMGKYRLSNITRVNYTKGDMPFKML